MIQYERMRFTTEWRAAFRVKSFEAAVIRRNWLGRGERGEGGGGGRRLEVTGGRATWQAPVSVDHAYL